MNEDLLQFIWNEALFNSNRLETTTGETLFLENRGHRNTTAGPDFSEAKIKIGNTLWAGSVEIHLRSSDWVRHGHENDPAYNNVVLHVVYDHDTDIKNQRGETLPTLALNGRISSHVIARYSFLKDSKSKVACADYFTDFPQLKFRMWLHRVLVSRLERKTADIALMVKYTNDDWAQVFYALLAGYLGQNTNKLPFQELARRLPFTLLSKHADNPGQLEALFFGVAGFIPKKDGGDYAENLRAEYGFLKGKYGLVEVTQLWKFGGVRPDAFPTRRIALLAALVPSFQNLCKQVLSGDAKRIIWPEIPPHPFWDKHYTFERESVKSAPLGVSEGLAQLLAINVAAPFMFHYGKSTGAEGFVEAATNLLEATAPEENQYVKSWRGLGFRASNAADTQALIELTSQFCVHKKCVLCNVGKSIISKQ